MFHVTGHVSRDRLRAIPAVELERGKCKKFGLGPDDAGHSVAARGHAMAGDTGFVYMRSRCFLQSKHALLVWSMRVWTKRACCGNRLLAQREA